MLNRVVLCLMIAAMVLAVAAPVFAAEEVGASEDINPLGPNAFQKDLAIWTAVVFVCLALVLGKFAWKPICEGLDKRERAVADQIAQAEAANQQAKELLAGYEKKLADAGEQVRGILDQGRRDAEQLGRELLNKAKEESKVEHERAIHQIEAATDAAVKELADRGAAMAVDLAGKIVRASIKPADHSRLIDEAVGGFVAGRN